MPVGRVQPRSAAVSLSVRVLLCRETPTRKVGQTSLIFVAYMVYMWCKGVSVSILPNEPPLPAQVYTPDSEVHVVLVVVVVL